MRLTKSLDPINRARICEWYQPVAALSLDLLLKYSSVLVTVALVVSVTIYPPPFDHAQHQVLVSLVG